MDGHSTKDCYYNKENPKNVLKDKAKVQRWLEKKNISDYQGPVVLAGFTKRCT